MNTESVRWNIAVSPETDHALRMLLASQGGRKGDLSRFIEDAVRARIFEATARDARAQNADTPAAEIDAAIREALAWAKTA
ncbi:ribbon-helix-helix domain-containing protein [Luteimonas sp. R10]|uniref:ribbon-helix-helix domain-containing protein n=1 Tax=Luteimonas sp. R10 TaxID=3108176 RepID=UPI003085B3FF|nr:ribbon-helix-helix domain-containing protein [Luteimonas sp. R10]